MKITIELTRNKVFNKVTIETESDHLTIHEVMQELIKPALLAWGFQPGSINEYIDEE